MVAWFVASLVHRIYVYFAIGMLATLHGMFHLGRSPELTPYFFGAMIAVSVCLARLLYEAGVETGRRKAIRRALAQLGVDGACQLPTGAASRVNPQDAPVVSILRHRL
jgi:hypothetical protein